MTGYWKWAKPFIDGERKATGSELAWIEVENFARRWLKREELEKEQYLESRRVPGKPRT
jgi:hypothetical protein